MIAVAVLGPAFARYDPTALVGAPFAAPSGDHWLGLDYLGRDALSRFLNGGRSVIALALLATVIGSASGSFLGLLAAYSRNWIDAIVIRLCDTVMSIPAVILVLVLVSAVGPKLWLVVLGVALTHLPRVARLVRGAALEVVVSDFVSAADARGDPTLRILRREILPNVLTPILVDFGVRFSGSVIIIASLSFLGFGLQPPASDWGLMINENRNGLLLQPYVVLAPILAIAVLTVGVNLLADGLLRAAGRGTRDGEERP